VDGYGVTFLMDFISKDHQKRPSRNSLVEKILIASSDAAIDLTDQRVLTFLSNTVQ
jgi:hypothetical protein